MKVLVDGTLDLARGRLAGGLQARVALAPDLGAGLRGVVDEIATARPDREVVADIDVDGPTWCDEARVLQLASNLLSNAVAHGQGAAKLSATVDDGSLTIEVWNAGEPIDARELPMLFKPFWRSANSAGREGLGLGLYICELIVEGHGGALSVSSTREAGTTFTARIPVAPKAPR